MLPCTSNCFHDIKRGGGLPTKESPYEVPFALREEIRRQLDDMLHRGVITFAFSEWAAPVTSVKRNVWMVGSTPKYRFCRFLWVKCCHKDTSLPHP
jgi:hypothetical protein